MRQIKVFIVDQKPCGKRRIDWVGGCKRPAGWVFRACERDSFGCKPRRGKPAIGVFFNVVGTRKIGFADGLQARDPTPAQSVRRRIAIQKVTQKKICPQFPWQAQRKNPDRGKPHAGMIVQIPSGAEFFGPRIKTVDTSVSHAGCAPVAF